ncbi:MAG TPA: hypothetical protein VE964_13430, partial [Myxococcales bacterium]|nr:hypothetical protein [Myxococcales bacterium]
MLDAVAAADAGTVVAGTAPNPVGDACAEAVDAGTATGGACAEAVGAGTAAADACAAAIDPEPVSGSAYSSYKAA